MWMSPCSAPQSAMWWVPSELATGKSVWQQCPIGEGEHLFLHGNGNSCPGDGRDGVRQVDVVFSFSAWHLTVGNIMLLLGSVWRSGRRARCPQAGSWRWCNAMSSPTRVGNGSCPRSSLVSTRRVRRSSDKCTSWPAQRRANVSRMAAKRLLWSGRRPQRRMSRRCSRCVGCCVPGYEEAGVPAFVRVVVRVGGVGKLGAQRLAACSGVGGRSSRAHLSWSALVDDGLRTAPAWCMNRGEEYVAHMGNKGVWLGLFLELAGRLQPARGLRRGTCVERFAEAGERGGCIVRWYGGRRSGNGIVEAAPFAVEFFVVFLPCCCHVFFGCQQSCVGGFGGVLLRAVGAQLWLSRYAHLSASGGELLGGDDPTRLAALQGWMWDCFIAVAVVRDL